MLLRRYGRLPVLFWSQGGVFFASHHWFFTYTKPRRIHILALATQLGVTFAQDLATSSGTVHFTMRQHHIEIWLCSHARCQWARGVRLCGFDSYCDSMLNQSLGL